MIRVALRLAGADARRAPVRSLAVAFLLTAAVWLPTITDAPFVLGALLAVGTAFAAAVGAMGTGIERHFVLDRVGAPPALQALVAAGSLAIPGVVACVTAAVTAAIVDGGPGSGGIVVLTLVVPVGTAPFAARAMGRWVRTGRGSGAARDDGSRWRRRVVLVVLVVACIGFPPLGLAVVGAYVASGAWSTDPVRRGVALGCAFVAIALGTFLVGTSTDWTALALALVVVIPVFVVAVAVIAVHAHALVAHRLSRTGPGFRLALAPLVLRRRVLAPLVALLGLVMTVAVTQGVVGASFGAREAERPTTLPAVTAAAGNETRQAIVPVPPVDPVALRGLLDERLAGTGVSAVVIDEVGLGGAASPSGSGSDSGLAKLALASLGSDVPDLRFVALGRDVVNTPAGGSTDAGPAWLGVVDPSDLASVGWGSAAQPLAAGAVVLVGGRTPSADGKVTVSVGGRTRRLPAQVVAGRRGGEALPGALVSAATAASFGTLATTARVVLVASPGAHPKPTTEQLVTLGGQIRDAVDGLPVVRPAHLGAEEQADLEQYADLVASVDGNKRVVAGGERVTLWKSGPLNAVPFLASTAGEAGRSAWPLGALTALITLAVVFLALGVARRDDEILEVQGAPERLRAKSAAIQAGVVSGTAAIVAVILGIGIPAASFAVYGARADLPGIPLVVPPLVWIIVAAVPAGTILCATVLPLLNPVAKSGGKRRHDDLFPPDFGFAMRRDSSDR